MAPLSVQSSGGGITNTVRASIATPMQRGAHRAVGRNAAGGDQRGRRSEQRAKHLKPGPQPVNNHVDHGLLEGRAQIRHVLLGERRDPLRFQPHRGLEAGE